MRADFRKRAATLFLCLSAACIGAASTWLVMRPVASTALAIGPPALLELTLSSLMETGNAATALSVVQAADKLEPDLAWLHALTLRRLLNESDPLMRQASLRARELLVRLPPTARAEEYKPLVQPMTVAPQLVYLASPESERAFGAVFEDAARLLGRGAPLQVGVGAPIDRDRPLVLAPGLVGLEHLPSNRLIALAPQARLEAALGLGKPATRPMVRCVLRSTADDLALLRGQTLELPVEGSVRVYGTLPAQRAVAVLACADGEYPALYRLDRGRAEVAYMFTFNVLESVVRTRQGDPAQQNKENDGVPGPRPSDLFTRDLSAAELQRPFSDLLLEAVLQLVEGEGPTLGFWHNPAGKRGVLIVTSDQDFAGDARMSIVTAALAQWRVPATFYLTSGTLQTDGHERTTAPSRALVDRARELGMSVAAHTYLYPTAVKPHHQLIEEHAGELEKTYNQAPHSIRFHYARWLGYTETAAALARSGYRYDLTYLTLNSAHIEGVGYMTGGGLPLRFYTEKGSPLAIRQLATQIDDHVHPAIDSGLRSARGVPLALSYAASMASTNGLIRTAARHYHSPITVNNHPFQFCEDPEWLRTLIETARVEQAAILDVEGYDAFIRALGDSVVSATSDPRIFRVLVQASEQDLVVRNYAGSSVLVDGGQRPLQDTSLFDQPAKLLRLSRGLHEVALR